MSKSKLKDAEPSLADLVSAAKVSGDLDAVLAELAAGIETAKQNLADAVARQVDLAIDPGAAADAALRAERLCETLRARHQEVTRKRDEMATAERRAAFEANVTGIYERAWSGAKDEAREIHRLIAEIGTRIAAFEGHLDAIDRANGNCRQRDRADLVRRKSTLRVEIGKELGADAVTPERLQGRVTKDAKETEDAFILRQSNIQAQGAWFAHAHDPLRWQSQRLVKALVRAFVDTDDLRQNLARRQNEAGQVDKVRQITPPGWAGQLDDDGESMVGIRGGRAE